MAGGSEHHAYTRTRDSIHRKRSPFYSPDRFTCEPENNRYTCPAGQPLNTPEFAKAQRQSKKVEALFVELKNQIGLHRLRCGD